MRTLTIRLPEDKYERLKELFGRRGLSLNRMIPEMITTMLAECDADARLALHVQRGLGTNRRAAVAAAWALGIDADLIAAGVQTFGPVTAPYPAAGMPRRAPTDDRKND